MVYEETDRTPIPLDAIDDPYDGAIYEAGLRALWVRPATFENFDLDVRGILRTDRERGLDDRTELGILTEYITRYGRGVGQIGLRHDARYDMERGETIYSRSALAIRPDEDFLAELQYSQARAIDALDSTRRRACSRAGASTRSGRSRPDTSRSADGPAALRRGRAPPLQPRLRLRHVDPRSRR